MSRRVEANYDVIVAGGGAGGVAAAVGAAKQGAKVCLVEKYGFLGGAATTSQVLTYCGLYQQGPKPIEAVHGVGRELIDDLRVLGLDGNAYKSETTGNWIVRLDGEVLKLALDRIAGRYGVDVLLHTRVAAATRTARRIEALTLAGMDGRWHVSAEAFIDATGDGNLSLVAGQAYRTGDGEGHLQALTMPLRIGGVARDLPFDRAAIIAAIDAYNPAGRFPVARTDGGIIIRLPISNDVWWMIVDLPLADLSSRSFSDAERTAREMAYDYVKLLRAGVPGFDGAYLIATGPQIGVRETRHPESRHRLTADDVRVGRQRDDGLARAAWPAELHGAAGKPTYTSIGGSGYFHVGYGSLRARDLDNLWYAGRLIGADPEAYGSIRVMGTAFATGEAAGVAAADFADRNGVVDVKSVQKRLIAQGALI
jgi:hypothetical protein